MTSMTADLSSSVSHIARPAPICALGHLTLCVPASCNASVRLPELARGPCLARPEGISPMPSSLIKQASARLSRRSCSPGQAIILAGQLMLVLDASIIITVLPRPRGQRRPPPDRHSVVEGLEGKQRLIRRRVRVTYST